MAKRSRSTHVLPEPNWKEYKQYTDESKREVAFSSCEYFVHYEVPDKSGVPHLKKWMKENYPADDVKVIARLPDSALHSFAKYAYVWSKLGYMTEKHTEFLMNLRPILVDKGNAFVADKEEAPAVKLSVVRNNLPDFIDSVEDAFHHVISGQNVKVESLIDASKLSAPELSKAYTEIDVLASEFREVLALRNKAELGDWDQQLVDGYSHVKLPMLKKLVDFAAQLQTGLLETKQSKKIVRIRRKKPTDKTKLVRKLKFMSECKELNLKSANPVDIIGASEVWVYDVKRKKIGVYASDYEGTLGVKGTSIDNYSDAKSYEKTLRKPELQLPEFMAARKNGLHKFVDSVRGKKLSARKRLLPDMVIVRII